MSVKDAGEIIATRHRYRLIGVDIKANKPDESLAAKQRILKTWFPNVFSEDGIPFVVNGSQNVSHWKRYGWISSLGWTEALAAATLGIFPKQACMGGVYTFQIEMAEDDSVRTDFDLIKAVEHADGVLPTAFIALNGKPDTEDFRVYWKEQKAWSESESNSLRMGEYSLIAESSAVMVTLSDGRGITDSVIMQDAISQSAFAYGVAGKLKELEDSGAVDEMLRRQEMARSKAPPYRVVTFKREKEGGFIYRFAIETEREASPGTEETIVGEISEMVKKDYAETFPEVGARSLVVEFTDVKRHARSIEGQVVVLTLSPISLFYDSTTRCGKISVRFASGQYDEARKWIFKNIETLARDKNIALKTGEIPPLAKFYLSREELKDGNVLEIEFKTE